MEFKNIFTDEQLHLLKEICATSKSIKSRYFSLGREWDKFCKLTDKLWGVDETVQTKGD